MAAVEALIEEAERDRHSAQRWGDVNHLWHFVLGIAAIVAGLLAGVSGAAGWTATLTAIGGFAAALLAGAQTFARPEDRAQFHFAKVPQFGAIALEARVLADRTTPPSEQEINALIARLTEIRARPFEARSQLPGPPTP